MISQIGSTTSLPTTAAGWSPATSESLDIISATCPNCHILVVEASSSSITDLGTAEDEAATLGAKFIDNDWYTDETSGETSYDTPTEAGWGESSGTAVSTAIIAAAYALAGTPASGTDPAEYPYEYPGGSYTTPATPTPTLTA